MPHRLTMLKEQGAFGMSFTLETETGELMVIDGGMTEETDQLLAHIAGRRVNLWVLTHPHLDHITAFMDVMEFHPGELQVDKIVYCFPELSFVKKYEPQEAYTLERFERLLPTFREKTHIARVGDSFALGGLQVEVLYPYQPEKPAPRQCQVNSTSLVFRVTTGKTSVLFLGDCDPTSGDILLERYGTELKSDYVQMAHHGHSGVGYEVYQAIAPRACLWCAPDWLYNEPPTDFGDRLYGTVRQREWMEKLGVKEHYVSGHGSQTILLP